MNDTDINPFPELTNEELDAIVNEINKEAGVFQDVVIEQTSADEYEIANKGKYMDTTYGTGSF
jgi:hypothetical protein